MSSREKIPPIPTEDVVKRAMLMGDRRNFFSMLAVELCKTLGSRSPPAL